MALTAALAAGPAHAYLFKGPRGTGKRAAARSFAAEILAGAAEDPDDTRRRALLDPSPHPDLVWLAPAGAQHMVEEVRERVIRAAAYRPFEGGKRIFVIEAAEAMRDESQNALLKTLEEPPAFVHLILLSPSRRRCWRRSPPAASRSTSPRCRTRPSKPSFAREPRPPPARMRPPPPLASPPATSSSPASSSPKGGASCAPTAIAMDWKAARLPTPRRPGRRPRRRPAPSSRTKRRRG